MNEIFEGDCLDIMPRMDANSIDCIVTDPPYGIGFMGKAWDTFNPNYIEKKSLPYSNGKSKSVSGGKKDRFDSPSSNAGAYDRSIHGNREFQMWCESWAKEAFRILKPGAHTLVFGGTRTFHRMTSGLEDAGFEIRDCMMWLYGSGFPKSHNLKGEWSGWGTALKPAWEPIIVARKPIEGTVAENVQKWGCGAINIDASRIGIEIRFNESAATLGNGINMSGGKAQNIDGRLCVGRWPANVILDEEAGAMLDGQSGKTGNGHWSSKSSSRKIYSNGLEGLTGYNDERDGLGGASRFFYCAKASKRERNAGLEGMPELPNMRVNPPRENEEAKHSNIMANNHPTVKPIALLQYLLKLACPPNGIVLDPFVGSGSTGIAAQILGLKFLGIEKEPKYVEITKARLACGPVMAA